MSNLLNTVLVSKGTNESERLLNNKSQSPLIEQRTKKPQMNSFSLDTTGKAKPFKDNAKLLPSEIIGSPFTYFKDLKNDFVSIGKAACGNANDHELGRINSLALKLGSLGIGAYLFAKNPIKMNKTMEITGFVSFMTAMAVWPKLAIQIPIKARTGVDFLQEYIDPEGRKKNLYQDPQYILTDLLPEKDLNNIGKKLDVDENLPDRDNFIKQRAHKTALQANTLWMMSAGIATPVMSALMCNTAEKIIKPLVESYELNSSEKECVSELSKNPNIQSEGSELHKNFKTFLKENKDKKLDKNMIEEIIKQFEGTKVKSLEEEFRISLAKEAACGGNKLVRDNNLLNKPGEDGAKELVKHVIDTAFGKEKGEEIYKAISSNAKENTWKTLADNIRNEDTDAISKSILKSIKGNKDLLKEYKGLSGIKSGLENISFKTVGDISETLRKMHLASLNFSSRKSVLDKFKDAKIAEKEGTYAANQWGRVGEVILNALDNGSSFSTTELNNIAEGDSEFIQKKFEALAKSDSDSKKTMGSLIRLVSDYEERISKGLFTDIAALEENESPNKIRHNKARQVFDSARDEFYALGENFHNIANKIAGDGTQKGVEDGLDTMIKSYTEEAKIKILSDKANFYRHIFALNVFAEDKNGRLKSRIASIMKDYGAEPDLKRIEKLVQLCKDVVLRAELNDFNLKFQERNARMASEEDVQIVMRAIYNLNKYGNVNLKNSAIWDCVKGDGSKFTEQEADKFLSDMAKFTQDFVCIDLNKPNTVTPEQTTKVINGNWVKNAPPELRARLAGKPLVEFLNETAKSASNTKKWKLLFGGIMAATTGVTVAAGMMFGRKDKVEQQAAEESRKNG